MRQYFNYLGLSTHKNFRPNKLCQINTKQYNLYIKYIFIIPDILKISDCKNDEQKREIMDA